MVEGLLAEGIDVRDRAPTRITSVDIEGAERIVSFGPDLADLLPREVSFETWDVPPVSGRFATAREAILNRLEDLIGRLP